MSQLDEALAQLEGEEPEPALETPAAAEPEVEAPADEAATAETEEAEEPETEDVSAEPMVSDPKLEAYLAKYDGDKDKALRAAVEAQELIGRQGNELGQERQARQELAERLARVEGRLEQPDVRLDQQTVDWFDEQIDTNPYAAVEWARQNRQEMLYERGMEAWYETNPRQATAYEIHTREQALREDLAGEVAQRAQPLEAQATQAALSQTWVRARGEIPDLDNHVEQIVETARENPELIEKLQDPDPDVRVRVIRNLYRIVKGSQVETAAAKTAEVTAAQAETDRADKQSGTAASQTTVKVPEQKTSGERWLDSMNLDEISKRYQ